ncbi:hypothetical protein [Mucilaginibacter antarcticus]|uniref:hypothetical protein n=1 Tax=Mucilaginibacter antarcticus TaxID=1855725 RepID=UPI00363F7380
MAPLVASKANVNGSNLQTLFVPFDNDTFIRYKSNELSDQANISAEVGVIYDRQSRKGLVLGSLTHDSWKSGVKSAGKDNIITQLEVWGGLNEVAVTRDSMPHGSLEGDHIKSPKVFIGYFKDWRTGLENYAKAAKSLTPSYIKSWAKATPVGWNSWGVLGSKLNYGNATGVVDFSTSRYQPLKTRMGRLT